MVSGSGLCVLCHDTHDVATRDAEGIEKKTYAIPLSLICTEATVNVTLHYETVPENWLHQMFAYAGEDHEIDRFRQMYEAADNTPVEIASDTKTIVTTSMPELPDPRYNVYPNPSDGQISIDGADRDTRFAIYTFDGRQVKNGVLTSFHNQLHLNKNLANIYWLYMIQTKPSLPR